MLCPWQLRHWIGCKSDGSSIALEFSAVVAASAIPTTLGDLTLNPTPSIRRTFRAITTAGVLVAGMIANVHAVTLHIDPHRSAVTYFSIATDFDGIPVGPQTFTMSGSFDVTVDQESFSVSYFPEITVDKDVIRFTSPQVDAGGATALGFQFPAFPGEIIGQDFVGRDDPCFLTPALSCSYWGPLPNFSGSYDGSTLRMTGSEFWSVAEGFQYRIVATVNPQAVPEPGTLACVVAGFLGLATLRRRMPS